MLEAKELNWIKISKQTAPFVYQAFEEYVDTTKRYCKQVWDDGYEEVFVLAGKKI